MAEILMVTSAKGGVGKTTFSAYFAYELASENNKVLLIEYSKGYRSLDIVLGVSQDVVYDISDVLNNNNTLPKAIIKSTFSENLDVICAPYKEVNIDFSRIETIIKKVNDSYDYIIFDTQPGLNNAFYSIFKLANKALAVLTADTASVRDTKIICDEIYNNATQDISIIINKFSKQVFLNSKFNDLDEIIDEIGIKLLGVIPFSRSIISRSLNGQKLQKDTLEKRIFKAIVDRFFNKSVRICID